MEAYCFRLKPGDPYNLTWPTKDLHPEHIEMEAGKTLRDFQYTQLQSNMESLEKTHQVNDNDVLIFPIIQAGQFGIREEEECLHTLFKHVDEYSVSSGAKPLIDFTSGYFGLAGSYQKLVQQSHTNCRVLCASPLVSKSGCIFL